MKRNEALPSNYLNKDDFTAAGILCQVAHVVMEDIKTDRGEERKPVLYIMGPNRPVDVTRGIILNGTNWDSLVEICGDEDSDNWANQRIVVFQDTEVRFGSKKVGGIRIRAPKQQAAPAKQAAKSAPAAAEEYDETNPPPPGDDDAIGEY